MLVKGFKPIVGKDARLVILGTLPGRISLERQEYYADPGNAFWFIVQQLFGIDRTASYDDRLEALINNRIAIWDVLKQAERGGSSDKNIVKGTEVPNDFAAFFRAHPSIKNVFFNGGAARKYFQSLVVPNLRLNVGSPRINNPALLSSSNATVGYTKTDKVENWGMVLGILEIRSVPAGSADQLGQDSEQQLFPVGRAGETVRAGAGRRSRFSGVG
jgi:hypoxanthine-DNA glycosylase